MLQLCSEADKQTIGVPWQVPCCSSVVLRFRDCLSAWCVCERSPSGQPSVAAAKTMGQQRSAAVSAQDGWKKWGPPPVGAPPVKRRSVSEARQLPYHGCRSNVKKISPSPRNQTAKLLRSFAATDRQTLKKPLLRSLEAVVWRYYKT